MLGKVNPVATLGAVAAIFTRELGCGGVASALELTISEAVARGLLGPGVNISNPTQETAALLLEEMVQVLRRQ